ncbi:hypothetical protein GX441_05930 [bacterium]|nr:hypothetical protein [bacterium]
MPDIPLPPVPGERKSSTSRVVRYVGIAVVFIAFTIAAVILGARFMVKNEQMLTTNASGVMDRWGGAITQGSPFITYVFEPAVYDNKGTLIKDAVIQQKMPSSDIKVNLSLSYRQRGQMRFPGYEVTFDADYVVANPFDRALPVSFNFPIPYSSGLLKDFHIAVDGEDYTADQDYSNGVDWRENLEPGESRTIHIKYTSRGMGDWSYGLGTYQGALPSFKLHLSSNFADIDYPEGTMAPTRMEIDEHKNKAELAWEFENLVSGQNIGVSIPKPLDVGKATAGVLFFVPLALIFFLGLILVLSSIKGVDLHPMHYLLITGGFFVFHILMSYLTTLVPLVWAFAISMGVSALMTVGYTALIRKGWPVIFSSVLGIILFELGFSLAQFFPEIRGLMLALIIISGLGIVMGFTAKVDWKGKL